MPEFICAHLCEEASIDAEGRLSIIGIFNKLRSAIVPLRIPNFYVVTHWACVPGEIFHHQVRIRSERGQLVGTRPFHTARSEVMGIVGTVEGCPNVVFPHHGKYFFEIFVDDELIHTLELVLGKPTAPLKGLTEAPPAP